jgi:hypothetical protein
MALVRARRLVFSDAWESDASRYQQCDTESGTYSIHRSLEGDWYAKIGDALICDPLASHEEAFAACQSWMDHVWLADTEVMPLEFVAWDDERAFRIEDGFTAYGAAGEYDLWLDDNKHVAASFRPNGTSESHVIHYEGKTKQDAMNSCNEHNRKTILGE